MPSLIYCLARSFALAVFTPCATGATPVTVSGFFDLAAEFNQNRPDNHESFIASTETTGKRANEFALNLAAVEFVREARPVRSTEAVFARRSGTTDEQSLVLIGVVATF